MADVPGGHHIQTSMWGRAKQAAGWEAARLVVREADVIVAGAQLLTKRVRPVGRVAYGVHTPLWRTPEARDHAIRAIKDLARQHRFRAILVQPPATADSTEALRRAGYGRSHVDLSLGATVVVDLERTPEHILASMKAKTRYNIRLSLRSPITVRLGTHEDLESLHRMLTATGRRQGFIPEPLLALQQMYRALSTSGNVELLVAELAGEAVSCILTVPFGDRVVYKRGAWSGLHGRLHPNERLHWEAMMRARTAGYSLYDFDGIDRPLALRVLDDERLDPGDLDSVSRFKLGFGGSIILLPQASTYLQNPAMRWGHDKAMQQLPARQIKRLAKRFRSL